MALIGPVSHESRLSLGARTGCDDPAVTKLLGLGGSSLLERCATIGAFSGGAIGGVVGLVVGLSAHWQTAWFAIFEAGIPAGVVGGILGAVVAVIVMAARRATGNDTPAH
jgi:hypothetical protein